MDKDMQKLMRHKNRLSTRYIELKTFLNTMSIANVKMKLGLLHIKPRRNLNSKWQ